ncbi:hypothetical protein A8L45_02950 [Veronia pacifica]|uniref:Lipoprotein n=1 Tax=Veronia pacifica TaxID=1080227 RepID=A0A1C3ER87_9GAMM|nr:hypothetical protein A8L45_02950 [Veronia pacifica]
MFATTLVFIPVLTACSDHPPIAVDQCGKVIAHAKQVLGSMAPDNATLMSQCQAATDSERGCVMAATKKGQLAQCM